MNRWVVYSGPTYAFLPGHPLSSQFSSVPNLCRFSPQPQCRSPSFSSGSQSESESKPIETSKWVKLWTLNFTQILSREQFRLSCKVTLVHLSYRKNLQSSRPIVTEDGSRKMAERLRSLTKVCRLFVSLFVWAAGCVVCGQAAECTSLWLSFGTCYESANWNTQWGMCSNHFVSVLLFSFVAHSPKNIFVRRSGKLRVLMGILEVWAKKFRKSLIFSQTNQMLDVIQTALDDQNYNYLR